MPDVDQRAAEFEAHRPHLRAVAYRMLGSLNEAEDAVQEAWLRFSRADTRPVENLAGWLTTVVSRLCLDMLRSRRARRELPLPADQAKPFVDRRKVTDPEQEAVLAESVGLALLVVLDRLSPAERVAWVLHDMFGVPFREIAPVVGRNEVATKKLASRARGRVRADPADIAVDIDKQRLVADAFITATRAGDIDALLAILDPEVVRRSDRIVLRTGVPTLLRGADDVADEVRSSQQRARFARLVLVDGMIGFVVAPFGQLFAAVKLRIEGERIVGLDVVAEPDRLAGLDVTLLPGAG